MNKLTLHFRFFHLERVKIDEFLLFLIFLLLCRDFSFVVLCAGEAFVCTEIINRNKRSKICIKQISGKTKLLFSDSDPSICIRLSIFHPHILIFSGFPCIKLLHVVFNFTTQIFDFNERLFILLNPF